MNKTEDAGGDRIDDGAERIEALKQENARLAEALRVREVECRVTREEYFASCNRVEQLERERDAALEAGATDVAAATRMRIERDEARAQLATARATIETLEDGVESDGAPYVPRSVLDEARAQLEAAHREVERLTRARARLLQWHASLSGAEQDLDSDAPSAPAESASEPIEGFRDSCEECAGRGYACADHHVEPADPESACCDGAERGRGHSGDCPGERPVPPDERVRSFITGEPRSDARVTHERALYVLQGMVGAMDCADMTIARYIRQQAARDRENEAYRAKAIQTMEELWAAIQDNSKKRLERAMFHAQTMIDAHNRPDITEQIMRMHVDGDHSCCSHDTAPSAPEESASNEERAALAAEHPEREGGNQRKDRTT